MFTAVTSGLLLLPCCWGVRVGFKLLDGISKTADLPEDLLRVWGAIMLFLYCGCGGVSMAFVFLSCIIDFI